MAVVTTIFKVSRHAHLGHTARRMGGKGLQTLDFLLKFTRNHPADTHTG